MRKILIGILIIFSTHNISLANAEEVKVFISEFTEQIFTVAQENSSIEENRAKLVNLIRNSIDMNFISKFVLGKYWRRTNSQDRILFRDLYEKYLISTYAPKFKGYKGEKFKILQTRELAKNKYQSEVKLTLASAKNVTLKFFVIQNQDDEYKIVDISGEGISFAATQRSEFGSLISQHGMSKFLNILRNKIKTIDSDLNNNTSISAL